MKTIKVIHKEPETFEALLVGSTKDELKAALAFARGHSDIDNHELTLAVRDNGFPIWNNGTNNMHKVSIGDYIVKSSVDNRLPRIYCYSKDEFDELFTEV